MKESAQKQLQLSPWDLCVILYNAGIIKDVPCAPDVQVVARNDVNKGDTVIISWSPPQVEVPRPEMKKETTDA